MAIYKQDIVNINLESGSIFRSFLNKSIGHKDDDADRFGVCVFRDGEAVDLSGLSCQAVFMAPNGVNIALTSYGTVSGNVAYVTLPPACYDYEGQFCLAIKLVGGGVTSTVRIVDGMVERTGTSGAVAPTSAVPTYQEILSVYDDMVAATSAANLAIAETFDATKDYPAGKNVINDGALYILPNGHTAGTTWANTTKTSSKLGDQITELKSAFDTSIINSGRNIIRSDVVYSQSDGAITNNGDGTYTVGTTDYGNIVFDDKITLKKGLYSLYGVPNGYSFVSTSPNHNNIISSNYGIQPKNVIINSDTECYVGFRIASAPSASFVIAPYLLQPLPSKNEDEINKTNSILTSEQAKDDYNFGRVLAVDFPGNAFDPDAATTGAKIEPRTGEIEASTNHLYSDYIPVEYGETYSYQITVSAFGQDGKRPIMYDATKAYIGYIEGTLTNQTVTFAVSDRRCVYVRINGYTPNIDAIIFKKGNSIDPFADYSPVTYVLQNNIKPNLLIKNYTDGKIKETYVTPEMFGAVGDGWEDDRIALQAAIDYASANRTKLILINKYLCSSSGDSSNNCIQVKSNLDMEICADAAIRCSRDMGVDEYHVLNIGEDVHNVYIHGNGRIRGDRLDHTGTEGEYGHCVYLRGCYDVTIEGILIEYGWGDGIVAIYGAHDCRILNCRFQWNSRNNISLIDSERMTIRGCTFDASNWRTLPGSNIDAEPSTSSQKNKDVMIDDCFVVFGNANSIMVLDSQGHNQNFTIRNIIGNHQISSYKLGSAPKYPENIIISDNIFTGHKGKIVAQSDNAIVSGNILNGTAVDVPITVEGENSINANNIVAVAT